MNVVCVVDDDDVYRFTIEKYIQMLSSSTRVISFADGEVALNYFKENLDTEENLPDIVLLDVNMPIMDGWDFLNEYERIKSRLNKEIRVYLVSSSIDERDQNRSRNYPAVTDYIVKPIDEKYLERLITQ